MRTVLKTVVCLCVAVVAQAQTPHPEKPSAFEPGQNVAGAVVGFGSIGSATASVGGRYEHAIRTLPDLGNGVLGFALDAGREFLNDDRERVRVDTLTALTELEKEIERWKVSEDRQIAEELSKHIGSIQTRIADIERGGDAKA